MNWSQISGIVDRAIIAGLMWMAGKGYIGAGDVNTYGAALLLLAGSLYGWAVNRKGNLLSRAASAAPEVKIIASQETADTIPAPNVMSAAEYEAKK